MLAIRILPWIARAKANRLKSILLNLLAKVSISPRFVANFISKMIEVFKIDKSTKIELPLFSDAVPAGFPSPADDYIENNLDLNKYLIQHPSSTFYIKVNGDSMVEANIYCGDILIIDRSIKIQNNDVALVILNGNFTVKRLRIIGKTILLVPENAKYQTVKVSKEMDFEVWGKVVWSIHKH